LAKLQDKFVAVALAGRTRVPLEEASPQQPKMPGMNLPA
jgi:hypothetical protein